MPVLTLCDHAEQWMKETSGIVPERYTDLWHVAYDQWIEYAFKGFKGVN